MTDRLKLLSLAGAVLLSPACTLTAGQGSVASVSGANTAPRTNASSLRRSATNPISHVVVVIQENRTVDNLFNGFPGADTVQYGKNEIGKTVQLKPISLAAPYDMSHRHGTWVSDYDQGEMNGFSSEGINCYARRRSDCPPRNLAAYGYVPQSQTQPYWTMAEKYTFADEVFHTGQGPSFPAHQYLVSGTSTIKDGSQYRASENAADPEGDNHQGGCDSVKSATVQTVAPSGGRGPFVFPCFDRISIMRLMNQHYVSWRYYQEFGGPGQWHAPDAIEDIRYSSSYANVLWPSSRVLKDISDGDLASVSFVTPSAAESDHPGRNDGSGPAWGGWYDHVKPTIYNSFELGFRVPMIVVSPYAKTAYVSHVSYEFGSILRFIEETFNLPSLNTTDSRANDLTDCFYFRARPRAFKPIPAKHSANYFERRPIDYRSVDDD